jgi:hypothetical protein
MKIRIFISFLAVMVFGMTSAFYPAGPPVTEKNGLEVPIEEGEADEKGEEITVSLSFEAVFQAFHFLPKSWVTRVFSYSISKNYTPVTAEFLIRDFVVPRSLTLFRQIISKNAP